MKKLLLILSCLFLLPAAGNPLFAQPQIDMDKLDRFFTELTQHNRFMGSVTVLQGEETIFSNAYGQMDETGTPAAPETIYRTGSIAKTYSAVMIMQLVEDGKLSVDNLLSEFFPSMPNAENITIEHLLRHRSGLQNFTSLPEYGEYYTESKTREELLEMFENLESMFQPGDQFDYSNTGYVLLSFIIEDQAGMTYGEALQQMIAEPLGLKSTYQSSEIDPTQGEAQSFRFMNSEWQLQPETDMSIPLGAGGVSSTAEETALFYRALMNGDLLSEKSLEKMTTFKDGYGYALFPAPFNDKQAIGHNGSIDGFYSHAGVFTNDDFTFALTANGMNYNTNEIFIGFFSILFGHDYDIPDFSPAETIALSAEQLDQYTGTYSSPGFPLDIRIFTENGNVYGQATGQGAFELTVVSETRMIFEAAGIVLEFDEPENSRFNAFTFSQGGMSFVFSRSND